MKSAWVALEHAQMDEMSLQALAVMFDGRCNEARARGLWLFELDPDFAAYCVQRFPVLVTLGSGSHRK